MLAYTNRAGQLSKSQPALNTVNFLSNMATLALVSPREPEGSFTIGDYLELLTPNPKAKGKYVCPVCQGHNLSVNKDGKRYSCFDSCDTKEIAYKLRELNGEFKPKKGRKPKQLTQGNNPDAEATTIVAESSDKPKDIKTNTAALKFIKGVWGQSLAFNLRSLEIELHGCKLDADEIHTRLADEFTVNMTKERAIDTCFYLARQKSYDPVKDWLTSLQGKASGFKQEGIAETLFNLREPYYDEMVWKWLVAAIKRAFEPGCKFDSALVLCGRQGLGKSTFFRTLANGSFSDAMSEKLNTIDMRILNRHWINEWGELDGFVGRNYSDKIKHFLSRQEDMFQLPYAKEIISYPRRSMIVGTTNEAEFLTDATGNRRFWILPVDWILPPDHLEAFRDELWAGVVADYWENWRGPYNEITLSEESRQRQAKENELYLWHDMIEEALTDYLHGKTIYVSMAEVAHHLQEWNGGVLGIKAGDRGTTKRIGVALNKLGWKRNQKWIEGKNTKIWVPPAEK